MIKAFKVQLLPTKEQEEKLRQSTGGARWAYNYALGKQLNNFEKGNKFIPEGEIRKEITALKKTAEYAWLCNVSAQIPKQAVKDLDQAYKRFFKIQQSTTEKYTPKTIEKAKRTGKKLTAYDLNGHPKFKSKHKSMPRFFQREDKLVISNDKAKLEKIGWVKIAEKDRIPVGKYRNPRVSFDGFYWYLSVGVEIESNINHQPKTEGIGIDVGVKDLAIISNSQKIKNINKTKEVRRLTKKMRRLQRQASRHYEKLKKEGGENRYRRTCNLLKLEKKILSVHRRLKNIRLNHVHQATAKLVKAKPAFIAIEDLNISGMMRNKHLARAVQEQKLYEFKRQLSYKCDWNGIPLILVDRFYPSSKQCSQCVSIKKDLKLSDRTYHCKHCGLEINRDVNASINLKYYGLEQFAS